MDVSNELIAIAIVGVGLAGFVSYGTSRVTFGASKSSFTNAWPGSRACSKACAIRFRVGARKAPGKRLNYGPHPNHVC